MDRFFDFVYKYHKALTACIKILGIIIVVETTNYFFGDIMECLTLVEKLIFWVIMAAGFGMYWVGGVAVGKTEG